MNFDEREHRLDQFFATAELARAYADAVGGVSIGWVEGTNRIRVTAGGATFRLAALAERVEVGDAIGRRALRDAELLGPLSPSDVLAVAKRLRRWAQEEAGRCGEAVAPESQNAAPLLVSASAGEGSEPVEAAGEAGREGSTGAQGAYRLSQGGAASVRRAV